MIEAKEFLESFVNYEREINYTYTPETFDLKRVEAILSKLGDPHKSLKAIHIAGTKGKGSTAYLIASVLRTSGFKVGLYTSPHIIYFTERIRILEGEDGRLISDEEFYEIVWKIRGIIEEDKYEFRNLTYFEIITCVCFYFFAREKVDYAVVEVGLGGRLDATNVITPLISVITPISFDHIKELGETLTAIAAEKAGIIKNNVPVIMSKQPEEVKKVIRDTCKEKNSVLYEFGKDFFIKVMEVNRKESVFDVNVNNNKFDGLHLTLIGEHQIINASVCLQCIEVLKNIEGIDIKNEAIHKTFANANFIGRLEIIQEEPIIILDGAHNEASAFYLRDVLKELFEYERLFLVLGMSSNKDIRTFADVLCPMAYEVVLTKADTSRAADPTVLIENELSVYSDKIICTQNVEEAIKHVLLRAEPRDIICFTGSFYILGEVKLFFADIDNY